VKFISQIILYIYDIYCYLIYIYIHIYIYTYIYIQYIMCASGGMISAESSDDIL